MRDAKMSGMSATPTSKVAPVTRRGRNFMSLESIWWVLSKNEGWVWSERWVGC